MFVNSADRERVHHSADKPILFSMDLDELLRKAPSRFTVPTPWIMLLYLVVLPGDWHAEACRFPSA